MKVYFISGLGADYRAFERLKLPQGYEMVHIAWQSAAAKESLQEYARKLSEEIDDKEPFILVGLSFGGLVAVEISKIKRPEKLILISTVATRKSIPALFKLVGLLNLDKIIPKNSFGSIMQVFYWFFGTKDKNSKLLIDYFMSNTSPQFLNWAISKIIRWENSLEFDNVIQIHGKDDRIFPVSKSSAKHIIAGGHLCVYTNSKEVTAIFKKELS